MEQSDKPDLPSGVVIQKARPAHDLANLPTANGRIAWAKSNITSHTIEEAEQAQARKIAAESDVVSLSWWRRIFKRKAK